ncbi:LIM domain containing protein [Acanthamoeba castellanii str. Neff]|uniref:LIM domain containing protein n=1 Tax=Acanthamoeba castellanii (strain ATCC 30010 / Neff) TaxID=1257118 RepID=L8HJA3_ACACF|nr:LIM domain containing protein [Acanthamoeba castellanii str. Neff]ELR25664.1 LIM domain containing protein [Acanthamoeba castellanii str. Neff]
MVIGKVLHALNNTYHPDHFCPFPGDKFVEHEGKPYCEEHYWEVYAPRCHACQQPIREGVIKALGRLYHPNHFTCQGCGVGLAGQQFKEGSGEPYCGDCKKAVQVVIEPDIHICAKCKKPIIGEYILLFGQRMHPENGLPYCEEHFKQLFGRPCSKCDLPVTQNGVEALGKTWHREHFLCQACDILLDPMGRICASEGKPLCKKCYLKLPSKMRAQIEKQKMLEAKMALRLKKEQQKERKREQLEAKKAAKAAGKAKP